MHDDVLVILDLVNDTYDDKPSEEPYNIHDLEHVDNENLGDAEEHSVGDAESRTPEFKEKEESPYDVINLQPPTQRPNSGVFVLPINIGTTHRVKEVMSTR